MTKCKVEFLQIAADGKGRIYGLDRAGRVWIATRNTEGDVVHWVQTTNEGVRPDA